MTERPACIRSTADVPERTHIYPQSTEQMGPVRSLGKAAGLERIGVNIQRLPPGTRSSWPHAEENEEEFVYVLAGRVDAWIDGHIHPMAPGDLATPGYDSGALVERRSPPGTREPRRHSGRSALKAPLNSSP